MIAVMGIDPGVRGGVAVLDETGKACYVAAFHPSMPHSELVRVVAGGTHTLYLSGSRHVFMEHVGYIKGDGGKGSFTFGRVDGLIRGALHALGFPPQDIRPMVWQGSMGCLSGGKKAVTKARAEALFPELKITHAVADALLIATFGRQHIMARACR